MITSIYASLLALIYVFLSIRIIRFRRSLKINLGDGNNPEVMRAIRVHANFAEYVPLCLILIYLIESHAAVPTFVHAMGMTLIVARLSHAYGISSESADFRFRVGGMALTFSVLILSSLFLLYMTIVSLPN